MHDSNAVALLRSQLKKDYDTPGSAACRELFERYYKQSFLIPLPNSVDFSARRDSNSVRDQDRRPSMFSMAYLDLQWRFAYMFFL